MESVLTIVALLVIWFIANSVYQQSKRTEHRRTSHAWGWALVGAIVGFLGAGPVGALAGTIPGAIVGYLLSIEWMKRDSNKRDYYGDGA